MVQVPLDLDSNIVIKLASTSDERVGAFKLLHDVYVEMGFCSPQPNGMRTIPHHSSLDTPVIIAKHRDKVVATLTLASDENFDLPIEKSWDLALLRNKKQKIYEVTCFAVDREYRRSNNKNVFFPIIQFMYQHAAHALDADYLVIATHPRVRDFYEGVLHFEPIDLRVIEDYIRAPAVAMFLDVKLLPFRYQKAYAHKPLHRNLFQYFADGRSVVSAEKSRSATSATIEGLATGFAFDATSLERRVEAFEAEPNG